MKLQLEASQDFTFEKGLYWKEGEDVPFCQKCLDGAHKRIRLQIWSDGWKCFECHNYYNMVGQAGRVRIFRPASESNNPL